MNNCIKNLLNIKDENIYFYENCVENKKINNVETKLIHGILTYYPSFCPVCGCVNNSCQDIIKWGFKHNCIIKLPKLSGYNAILLLDKQRFLCRNCNKTFIASTSVVNKNCNISNSTNLQIQISLTKKISEKDIAKDNNVSVSKVDEILNVISQHPILRHQQLPLVMNWDEFKATKDTKGGMAFIITDPIKKNIFDIQDNRFTKDLEKYFSRFSRQDRNKVKLISMDMYEPYIILAHKMFKNANIVIDRFHLVIQAYNALNITRVKLMKHNPKNYNKFKRYWKLILKNKFDLDDKSKKYSSNFGKEVTQKYIVDYLINTDKSFKASYDVYQAIINSIKDKDFIKFKTIIHAKNDLLSDNMKQTIKTYIHFEKYIENSFYYDINNGIIEGTNNLIKCIKRIAFGYKRFDHFVARIMLIKGLLIN